MDPFDALADSLPSSESFAPAAHVYTGPEVIEVQNLHRVCVCTVQVRLGCVCAPGHHVKQCVVVYVTQHGLTSKKGVICGGDDCPLPPGYRSEDMVSL